jgi:purine-binding chemotaxis protein CheW
MTETTTQTAVLTGAANQYLTFVLGDEEYGLDILKVQEIKGYSKVTPIPDSPRYVQGVMNLRGTVVPVVCLRGKFAMGEVPNEEESVFIVVTVHDKLTGLLVDAVSDVLSIHVEDIQPAPELSKGVDSNYISGIGCIGERLITLLDIEEVLGADILT